MLDQLAPYVSSLSHIPDSPYRQHDGQLSVAAKKGKQHFDKLQCAQCHGGQHFTDSASQNLHDVGTLLPSSGHRLHQQLLGLDTPTLKGLWQTGPYLHDGRASNLHQVLLKFNTSGQHGPIQGLNQIEQEELVEYLLGLDDNSSVPQPATESPSYGKTQHQPHVPITYHQLKKFKVGSQKKPYKSRSRWAFHKGLPEYILQGDYYIPQYNYRDQKDYRVRLEFENESLVTIAHEIHGEPAEWLSTWKKIDQTIKMKRSTFHLYTKILKKGSHIFGPNGDNCKEMYLMFSKPI